MCGFCGFVDVKGSVAGGELAAILERMTAEIQHRGPDDSGVWVDRNTGVALGHRRLSILDLSPEGHQPMVSSCGRYVIVFNGEIYNYRAIREELENLLGPIDWRGHSDTEVMLAAIAQWGVHNALIRFNGMFVFAVWDREERILHLARDRLGEKPLYYGWMGNTLLFGSELKSMRVHPAWRGDVDRNSLALMMRHNYIPAPYSIYRDIYKLPPASLISFQLHGSNSNSAASEYYWSARDVAERGSSRQLSLNDVAAEVELDSLLREAVRLRMEADVPLGAFLSGGIDSSTVVALMQAQSSRPVKTFSIGFQEDAYNEADHALAVAKHLETEHTELYVSPEQARSVIPDMPALYDEPFSDASQIPTFLVSQLARQHVTVSLSGDGGDELFAGYNRYFWGMRIWNHVGWMPGTVRKAAAVAIKSLSPQTWDKLFGLVNPVLPRGVRQRTPGDKLQKLADILAVDSRELLYQGLVSHWRAPDELVIGSNEPATVLTDSAQWPMVHDFAHYMMFQDMVSYLPDDILVKVDRASMGVSLEARVPLLDHRVAEFAWQLPTSLKIRDGQGKWLLRQVLYRYVPRELMERPKMGFGVPIDEWLRGPLREWAEDLLGGKRLREEAFFDPDPIRKKWNEHLSGARNWQYHLWDILMFQAWLDVEKAGAGSN